VKRLQQDSDLKIKDSELKHTQRQQEYQASIEKHLKRIRELETA